MIRGVHTMYYTSQPEATRAFFRDKLRFPYTDVGEGWLIFELPAADQGFHPAEPEKGVITGTPSISFYCDDIEKTVAELMSRGIEFTGPIEDHGYGLVTFFKVPGDFAIQLYQPRYVKNPQIAPALESAPPAPERHETPAAKPKPTPAKKTPPPVKKAIKRPAAKAVKAPPKKKPAKAKGRRR